MAESARGHVLWLMLLLLGLLAELAVGSLQLALQSALDIRAEMARQSRDARADAMAAALEALPLPSAGALPGAGPVPWAPATAVADSTIQGCGGALPGSYLAACAAPVAGELSAAAVTAAGWHWQLRRLPDDPGDDDGTDYTAFPALRPQRWQLQVVVAGRDRGRSAWRYSYRQQAAP